MPNSGAPDASSRFRPGFNDGALGLLAAAILLVGAVVWSGQTPRAEKTDFALTYMGAVLVHEGLGARLYDIELQKETLHRLFQHPNPLFFEHPPFEALLFSPLAAFSFRTAYLIWGLLNAVVWLLLIYFLRPYLPWPGEVLGYVCLWLLFAPLVVALYQGQSSIILLALFCIAFVQLRKKRGLAAGLVLGLGLFKFQFVLPFALISLLRKKWQFLIGFVISSCVLGTLSVAATGFQGVAQYFRFVLTVIKNPHNASYGSAVDMPTINGLLYAVVGERVGHVGLSVASALLSILLLIWVSRRWPSEKPDVSSDLVFGAAIAASLVAGAHMFTHDFSPLILAMFLTAANIRQAIAEPRIAVAIVLTVFWTFPIYFVLVAWHCLYLICPVLLLFVYLAVRMARHASRLPVNAVEYAGA
jgi:hypothetical protein